MTTTPVVTITDEQIAEIEAAAEINAYVTNPWRFEGLATASTVSALISRLRAAEKDAERYRWLCDPEDNSDLASYAFAILNTWRSTKADVDAAIDAAMEQSE